MRWFLIVVGAVLLVLGLLWPLVVKLPLGRLPGDIVIEREGFRLYLPIATMLLLSAAVTFVLWLIRR
jgi:hypothetical protein